MKLMILNGPNINMIGIREKNIYGQITYDEMLTLFQREAHHRGVDILCFQSNHEGQLVDWIQQAYFDQIDGIIINPAAYTHTSIAILDAIKAIAPLPCVEVHLSDIEQREEFRKVSFPALGCLKQIAGHGIQGYIEAMDFLIDHYKEKR